MPGNPKLQTTIIPTKTFSQQIQRCRIEGPLRPLDNAPMPTMHPQRILCLCSIPIDRDDETERDTDD
jgi:hypothetical protein